MIDWSSSFIDNNKQTAGKFTGKKIYGKKSEKKNAFVFSFLEAIITTLDECIRLVGHSHSNYFDNWSADLILKSKHQMFEMHQLSLSNIDCLWKKGIYIKKINKKKSLIKLKIIK